MRIDREICQKGISRTIDDRLKSYTKRNNDAAILRAIEAAERVAMETDREVQVDYTEYDDGED